MWEFPRMWRTLSPNIRPGLPRALARIAAMINDDPRRRGDRCETECGANERLRDEAIGRDPILA